MIAYSIPQANTGGYQYLATYFKYIGPTGSLPHYQYRHKQKIFVQEEVGNMFTFLFPRISSSNPIDCSCTKKAAGSIYLGCTVKGPVVHYSGHQDTYLTQSFLNVKAQIAMDLVIWICQHYRAVAK